MSVTVEDGKLRIKVQNLKKVARSARLSMLHAAAKGVIEAEKRGMAKQIDRPTPFSLSSMGYRVKVAGTTSLAVVYIKDRQREYLRHQILGTNDNKWKPIPVDRFKNKYGNLPRNAQRSKKRRFTMRKHGIKLLAFREGHGSVSYFIVYAVKKLGRDGTVRFKWVVNAEDYLTKNEQKLFSESFVKQIVKSSRT